MMAPWLSITVKKFKRSADAMVAHYYPVAMEGCNVQPGTNWARAREEVVEFGNPRPARFQTTG